MHMGLVKTIKLTNIIFFIIKYSQGPGLHLHPKFTFTPKCLIARAWNLRLHTDCNTPSLSPVLNNPKMFYLLPGDIEF